MSRITLIPVEWRDYKSKAEVEADFRAERDFRVCDMSSTHDGRATTRSELLEAGITIARIRYWKLRKVVELTVLGS